MNNYINLINVAYSYTPPTPPSSLATSSTLPKTQSIGSLNHLPGMILTLITPIFFIVGAIILFVSLIIYSEQKRLLNTKQISNEEEIQKLKYYRKKLIIKLLISFILFLIGIILLLIKNFA